MHGPIAPPGLQSKHPVDRTFLGLAGPADRVGPPPPRAPRPRRCSPRSMLTAADRGLAYGGGTGVANDIEVDAHYGHEGGVDYQVDWQLGWIRGMLPRPGLTIAMTVWTNTTNTLRWMEASTPSSQKYGPADQPRQIWALHDVGSAAPKLATRGGPNRAVGEPRPRRATCTDAGALTARTVFVDDEEAADRRPAKATSADLILVGRTDATEGPRATVDYARPS